MALMALQVIIMTTRSLNLYVTAITYSSDALKTSYMMKDS